MKQFFLIDTMLPIEEDKRFASLVSLYAPKEGIRYFGFTFHGTAPIVNRKGMAITLPTHKNSMESAIDTQIDFEHIAEDIGDNERTEIIGHICSLYMDEEDSISEAWIIPDIIPTKPVITRGVMALFTRVKAVNNIAQAIKDGDTWYFSLEVGNDVTPPEIWVASNGWEKDAIYSWDEAPDDLKQCASAPTEMYWNGKKVAYLMGGRNGKIQYIGGAITKRPAGYEQNVEGNQLKYICSMDEIPSEQESLQTRGVTGEMKFEIYKEFIEGKTASIDNFVPVLIETKEEFIQIIDYMKKIGGDKMPEFTDEEFAQKIEEAKKSAIADSLASGEVLPVTALEGRYTKEEVDAMVKKEIAISARESKIASLPVDEETRKDLIKLATDEAVYPYTEDGAKAVDTAIARWTAIFTTKEKASASMGEDADGDKAKFTPPNNDGNVTKEDYKRIGMA